MAAGPFHLRTGEKNHHVFPCRACPGSLQPLPIWDQGALDCLRKRPLLAARRLPAFDIIIYKHNIYARGIPWDVFGVRPGPVMRVRSCEAFFCFAQGTSMNWRTYNENQWDDSCWELASLCMLVRHDVGPKIEALAMKRSCVASVSECVCVCLCMW